MIKKNVDLRSLLIRLDFWRILANHDASPLHTSSETMKDGHIESRFEENRKDPTANVVFCVLSMAGFQQILQPKSPLNTVPLLLF